MIDRIRNFAAGALASVGYYDLLRRRDRGRGKRLLVLMYHDIVSDESRELGKTLDEESPTTSQFAAHIREVARRDRMVTMQRAIREMNEGGLKEDAVAITFDDGYQSTYTNALPVLARYDAPATLFALTGWINREMSFWWHSLRALVERAPMEILTDKGVHTTMGIEMNSGRGNGIDPRRYRVEFARTVEAALRDVDDSERMELIGRLHELVPDAPANPGQDSALTWNQVRELSAQGFEVAAHTRSHPNFRYATPELVAEEVQRSKADLERQCGLTPVGFAYPYGKDLQSYRKTEGILRSQGLEYACTTVPGVNDASSNFYALRRISLPASSARGILTHRLSAGFSRDNAYYGVSDATSD